MGRPSKSALFEAARAWDASRVRALIEASADLVRAVDPSGRTALHLACSVKPGARALGEANGLETVTALLNGGAELEFAAPGEEDEGDFRATPLWFAVARGENPALVRLLLQRGVDASFSLWAVVWRDDDAMCRELLRSRPRLNLLAHGETPIFYAARLKRLKTLNLLIDAGADPAIRDRQGRDAVDIARARRLSIHIIDRLAAARPASKS
jgi:ankyrin repeat protein